MHSVSEAKIGRARHGRRLTRAEQQAITRGRVLDAADRVFADRGFHGATLDEIALAAGYTRGAVYSNFRNKDDLALAIVERRIEAVVALLRETVRSGTDPVAQAALTGERLTELLGGEPGWAPLFLEFAPHAARDPALAVRLAALWRSLVASIADVLADAAGGEMPYPAERLALTMVAATDGAALARLIDPEVVDERLLGEMLGLIVAGVVASARDAETGA